MLDVDVVVLLLLLLLMMRKERKHICSGRKTSLYAFCKLLCATFL